MRKLRTNTRKTINLREWNSFVEEVYGRPYDFQQQDGCKSRGIYEFTVPTNPSEYPPDDFENDRIPEVVNHEEMGVSFKAWLARDPKQLLSSQQDPWDLTLWWSCHFYPAIKMVANDLHKRGLLEAGEYTILIDW